MTQKGKRLEEVYKEAQALIEKLYPTRHIFVPGLGNESGIMVVAEAPEEREMIEQRPCAGRTEKRIEELLKQCGLAMDEAYITNVCKVRPCKMVEGRIVNRPPNKEEIALFKPFLVREIAIIKPPIIIALGNTATQTLLGEGINTRHSRAGSVEVDKQLYTVYPMYHPLSRIYDKDIANLKMLLKRLEK